MTLYFRNVPRVHKRHHPSHQFTLRSGALDTKNDLFVHNCDGQFSFECGQFVYGTSVKLKIERLNLLFFLFSNINDCMCVSVLTLKSS